MLCPVAAQLIFEWMDLGWWTTDCHPEFPARHRACVRTVLRAALRGRVRDGAAAVSQATLGATPVELWLLILGYLCGLDFA